MPGYSGTPLVKKLGIKPGFRVHLANAPADVRNELRDALAECDLPRTPAAIDFAMVFAKSRAELSKRFGQLSKVLTPTGMLWTSWPKKASGVETDLNENEVRALGLSAGLVDVKVCAVTEIWSGLKFVRRLRDR
jgi:hypothetical protein